eukprot:g1086.t1
MMSRIDAMGLGTPNRARRKPRPELSEDQKQEIREAFELFDTSKCGSIDYHELKVAMRALGFPITKPEVVKVVKEYDREETGRIGFSDFMEIIAERTLARDPEEEMRKAFHLFDEDGSGFITIKNLRHVCKELGEQLSSDEMQAMIDEFDRDQDGQISEDEFVYIMRQTSIYDD